MLVVFEKVLLECLSKTIDDIFTSDNISLKAAYKKHCKIFVGGSSVIGKRISESKDEQQSDIDFYIAIDPKSTSPSEYKQLKKSLTNVRKAFGQKLQGHISKNDDVAIIGLKENASEHFYQLCFQVPDQDSRIHQIDLNVDNYPVSHSNFQVVRVAGTKNIVFNDKQHQEDYQAYLKDGVINCYLLHYFSTENIYIRAFILKSFLKHLKTQDAEFSKETAQRLVEILGPDSQIIPALGPILDEKYHGRMFGMTGKEALEYIFERAKADYQKACDEEAKAASQKTMLEQQVLKLQEEVKRLQAESASKDGAVDAVRRKLTAQVDRANALAASHKNDHEREYERAEAFSKKFQASQSAAGEAKKGEAEAKAALESMQAQLKAALEEKAALQAQIPTESIPDKQAEIAALKVSNAELREKLAKTESDIAKITGLYKQSLQSLCDLQAYRKPTKGLGSEETLLQIWSTLAPRMHTVLVLLHEWGLKDVNTGLLMNVFHHLVTSLPAHEKFSEDFSSIYVLLEASANDPETEPDERFHRLYEVWDAIIDHASSFAVRDMATRREFIVSRAAAWKGLFEDPVVNTHIPTGVRQTLNNFVQSLNSNQPLPDYYNQIDIYMEDLLQPEKQAAIKNFHSALIKANNSYYAIPNRLELGRAIVLSLSLNSEIETKAFVTALRRVADGVSVSVSDGNALIKAMHSYLLESVIYHLSGMCKELAKDVDTDEGRLRQFAQTFFERAKNEFSIVKHEVSVLIFLQTLALLDHPDGYSRPLAILLQNVLSPMIEKANNKTFLKHTIENEGENLLDMVRAQNIFPPEVCPEILIAMLKAYRKYAKDEISRQAASHYISALGLSLIKHNMNDESDLQHSVAMFDRSAILQVPMGMKHMVATKTYTRQIFDSVRPGAISASTTDKLDQQLLNFGSELYFYEPSFIIEMTKLLSGFNERVAFNAFEFADSLLTVSLLNIRTEYVQLSMMAASWTSALQSDFISKSLFPKISPVHINEFNRYMRTTSIFIKSGLSSELREQLKACFFELDRLGTDAFAQLQDHFYEFQVRHDLYWSVSCLKAMLHHLCEYDNLLVSEQQVEKLALLASRDSFEGERAANFWAVNSTVAGNQPLKKRASDFMKAFKIQFKQSTPQDQCHAFLNMLLNQNPKPSPAFYADLFKLLCPNMADHFSRLAITAPESLDSNLDSARERDRKYIKHSKIFNFSSINDPERVQIELENIIGELTVRMSCVMSSNPEVATILAPNCTPPANPQASSSRRRAGRR